MLQKMTLEGALANRTLERFHTSVVAAQMFAQSVGTSERFSAHRTRIIPFAGMTSQMHLTGT